MKRLESNDPKYDRAHQAKYLQNAPLEGQSNDEVFC